MATKFLQLKDEQGEAKQVQILPPAFWSAFLDGKSPGNLGDAYSHHLEQFVPLLSGGQGYAVTIYFRVFLLNIVAIRGACYVNIYPVDDLNKRIGVVYLNPARGWVAVKYMTGLTKDIINERQKIKPEVVLTPFLQKAFEQNEAKIRSLGLNPIRIQGNNLAIYSLNSISAGLRCFTKALRRTGNC